MANISGTNVAAKVVPFTTEDTYATHESNYGLGGWHQVATINDRDAIPAARLTDGTACYVRGTNTVYVYRASDSAWIALEATTDGITGVAVDGTEVPIVNRVAQVDITGKQDVIDDLTTIRSGAALGATSLQSSDILNNVSSTETTKALSANMGREIQAQVDNLKARGRFLSVWDCTTGLPGSDPVELTSEGIYNYKSGDYYIISKVATTQSEHNYKPSGTYYEPRVPSTAEETEKVLVNGSYYFDGTNWITTSGIEQSVYFGSIAGNATDNQSIADELANKVTKNNAITAGTHTKITYDTKGLVTAGSDLTAEDIPSLDASKITSGTLADERIASASTWNAKQDALPALQPNKYLHVSNSSQLEWGDVEGVLGVNVDGVPVVDPVTHEANISLSGKQDALPSPTAPDRFLHYYNNAYQWSQAIKPSDNITLLTNNAGYTSNTGTVTKVTAGTGLTGGDITSAGTIAVDTTVIATKQDIAGKQDIIDTTHKLSSDLVDDTDHTNKFVTAAEKTSISTAVQPNDNVSVLTNDAGYITSSYHDSTKQDVIDSSNKLSADFLSEGNTNKLVSAAEKTTWSNKQDALTAQTAYTNKGTATKVAQITTNSLGQVTNINEVDIAKTTLTDLGITATAEEINTLDGVVSTLTANELNQLDGIDTSVSVQTQLNSKSSVVANPSSTSTGTLSKVSIDGATYDISGGGGGIVQDVKVNNASVLDSAGIANINIKTINSTSIIGSGDVQISATIVWNKLPHAWDTNPMTSAEVTTAGYTTQLHN